MKVLARLSAESSLSIPVLARRSPESGILNRRIVWWITGVAKADFEEYRKDLAAGCLASVVDMSLEELTRLPVSLGMGLSACGEASGETTGLSNLWIYGPKALQARRAPLLSLRTISRVLS